jgi:hypothetical protein
VMVETDVPLAPDEVQPTDEYGFVTTLLANYDDVAQLEHDIREWWTERTGQPPILELELLTSDLALMLGEVQASAAQQPFGHWNLSGFIGFRKSSASSRTEARSFAIECCMRVQ